MHKRLNKAARCAISMRSRESNKKLAIKLLREDLHNGPRHCFGIHIKCSTDFCKTARERLSQQSASSAPVGSSEISPEQTVSSQTAVTSFQTPVSSSQTSVSSSQTPVSFYSDSAVCISDNEDILSLDHFQIRIFYLVDIYIMQVLIICDNVHHLSKCPPLQFHGWRCL